MSKSKKKDMGNFIAENWAVLLGGGTVTSLFGWIVYGRKNNNVEYIGKVQIIFEKVTSELEKDRDYYKQEYIKLREEHKSEVAYFRNQIDDVRKSSTTLQKQFNDMSISYTKEVEISQNWEKLYRELTIQNKELEKANEEIKKDYEQLYKSHEDLKKDHEKLKKAFNTQQNPRTPRIKKIEQDK